MVLSSQATGALDLHVTFGVAVGFAAAHGGGFPMPRAAAANDPTASRGWW